MIRASGAVGKRQLKNTLARYMITLGGVSVLFTLVLIFLYLLYVIKPIFESAQITHIDTIQITEESKVLAAGLDELKQVTYQLTEQGKVNFYQIEETVFRQPGDLLLSLQVTEQPISTVVVGNENYQAVVDIKGNIYIYSPKYITNYLTNGRDVIPKLEFPLGKEAIQLSIDNNVVTSLLTIFDFVIKDNQVIFVSVNADNKLIKTTLILGSDNVRYREEHQIIPFEASHINNIELSPDGSLLFVHVSNNISVFDLSHNTSTIEASSLITSSDLNKNITAMSLLSGGSSLLVGYDDGTVSQWFEVAVEADDGSYLRKEFKEIRQFVVSDNEPVDSIYPEQYRKSFFTLTPSGELSVFYTTSEVRLWQGHLDQLSSSVFSLAPRADAFVIATDSNMALFSIKNEHPEVTWQALWQEVWYEGYQEPEYIWQSTSGTDDFEAKFSLIPLSFGTLKAALYAMLFAVPIALSAAIYTAFFMPAALRKKVKPTIELMEALPTVIIGFLAGLWLAPIIENYLPAIFLMLIFLPLSILFTAMLWSTLSIRLKSLLPESWAPLMLIPVLLFAGYLMFTLSPTIENLFFAGDIRQYITNEIGLNFDQRNALVVGIAMGFAVIPTIFSMAEDAIFSVPKHLTSGSLALGATPWQTLIKVVLLTASPGIFSAIMMGLGRAVGETMIVLMATGNTPVVDWSIFQGMRTLAANIAVEMPESEVGSSHYRILFLAAFVLFVFTFMFNTIAELVRQRLREKYSEL